MKRLEKRLKRLLLLFIRILFPRTAHTHASVDWRSFERILVFRLDSRLGNCILILPLVQAIKISLPQAHIDVLITSRFSEIYENHPAINRVIPYDQGYLLKRPWRFLKIMRKLKQTGYDAVFSSSNPNTLSVSQAFFARMITSGCTVGFKWRESEYLFTDVVVGRTDIFYGESQVDLWRYFDAETQYQPPRIYIANHDSEQSAQGVLIWLGARGGKVIPEPLLMRIIHLLEKMRIDFSYAAGPADSGLVKKYTTEIAELVTILSGNLRQTAQFLKRFRILIMPDTGPMHLAAALNIPLIQVFIESNKKWYGYQGDNQIILSEKDDVKIVRDFIVKHTGDQKYAGLGKVLQ